MGLGSFLKKPFKVHKQVAQAIAPTPHNLSRAARPMLGGMRNAARDLGKVRGAVADDIERNAPRPPNMGGAPRPPAMGGRRPPATGGATPPTDASRPPATGGAMPPSAAPRPPATGGALPPNRMSEGGVAKPSPKVKSTGTFKVR